MKVELFDFSKANESQKHRERAISLIASVCYGNSECKNVIGLYDKLLKESDGYPSSSFEFIPVVIELKMFKSLVKLKHNIGNLNGSVINEHYLTNLKELYTLTYVDEEAKELLLNYHNTDTLTQDVIKRNFFVFKQEVPKYIAVQDMRHRKASYQELSRRYTKDSKIPFTFNNPFVGEDYHKIEEYFAMGVELYNDLLVHYPAQVSRAVIPFGFNTTYWSAYNKKWFEHMISLRNTKYSQPEMKLLAEKRLELVTNKNYKEVF